MIPRKLMHESDNAKLEYHFLTDILDHDRYLRFGYNASDEAVSQYLKISLLDFGKTTMWFVCEVDNRFVGTCHVSIMPRDIAEMGFTVSPDYRNKGLGQELFHRGATWAMMKGAKTLYTQCLSENVVMQHIAKKNGMTVVTFEGTEKEATIKATKGTIRAFYDDRMFDQLAFVDMSITKQFDLFTTLMRL